MGKGDEKDERDDNWGNTVARWTFISTVIGGVLFIGSVFVFILR